MFNVGISYFLLVLLIFLTVRADPEAHVVHVSTELLYFFPCLLIFLWEKSDITTYIKRMARNGVAIKKGYIGDQMQVWALYSVCASMCDKWHRPHMSTARTNFNIPGRDLLSACVLSAPTSGFLRRERDSRRRSAWHAHIMPSCLNASLGSKTWQEHFLFSDWIFKQITYVFSCSHIGHHLF